MENVLTKVEIPGFKWKSGKVRDWTQVDDKPPLGLMITTDRISAFDVVLPTVIPGKGRVLDQLSIFWKRFFVNLIPNDIVSCELGTCLPYLGLTPASEWAKLLDGRITLFRIAERIPVECVVRGYISGSLWQEYLEIRGKTPVTSKVTVLGHEFSGDLLESEELPQSIFTPAIKVEEGHDINLTQQGLVDFLDSWLATHPEIKRIITPLLLAKKLEWVTLFLYTLAKSYARQRGLIIADAKLEFGFVEDELILTDEVFTPDSSRFWGQADYQPGRSQRSYDKQPVRDWLLASGWNQEPPAPELPSHIVAATTKRYSKVRQLLIGGVPK